MFFQAHGAKGPTQWLGSVIWLLAIEIASVFNQLILHPPIDRLKLFYCLILGGNLSLGICGCHFGGVW